MMGVRSKKEKTGCYILLILIVNNFKYVYTCVCVCVCVCVRKIVLTIMITEVF